MICRAAGSMRARPIIGLISSKPTFAFSHNNLGSVSCGMCRSSPKGNGPPASPRTDRQKLPANRSATDPQTRHCCCCQRTPPGPSSYTIPIITNHTQSPCTGLQHIHTVYVSRIRPRSEDHSGRASKGKTAGSCADRKRRFFAPPD